MLCLQADLCEALLGVDAVQAAELSEAEVEAKFVKAVGKTVTLTMRFKDGANFAQVRLSN